MSRNRKNVLNFTAHPRSRGEHAASTIEQAQARGSSPLARGTYHRHAVHSRRRRLIPARAGNMSRASAARVFMAAHPRSRGEHVQGERGAGLHGGSSPLARGTSAAPIFRAWLPRLIPARAGNIEGSETPRRFSSAHPRSRGEHKTPIIHCVL